MIGLGIILPNPLLKNMIMRKYFVLLLLMLAVVPTMVSAKKVNKETMQWRYEIQDLNITGKQGTCVFKIWTYAKKQKDAIAQAGKNAVHAVIFKGYGYQPALVSGAEVYDANQAFFDEFFKDGGQYQLYVQCTNNGAIAPQDNIKLDKEFKIGIKVIVRKDALREALEKSGVIKAANYLF